MKKQFTLMESEIIVDKLLNQFNESVIDIDAYIEYVLDVYDRTELLGENFIDEQIDRVEKMFNTGQLTHSEYDKQIHGLESRRKNYEKKINAEKIVNDREEKKDKWKELPLGDKIKSKAKQGLSAMEIKKRKLFDGKYKRSSYTPLYHEQYTDDVDKEILEALNIEEVGE